MNEIVIVKLASRDEVNLTQAWASCPVNMFGIPMKEETDGVWPLITASQPHHARKYLNDEICIAAFLG